MLEAMEHEQNCFVTLTYNKETIPTDLCVKKRHAQLFLKRLRKTLEPRKIRYYIVGEYGSETQRPHYHAILFGVSPTEERTIASCWTAGHIHVGTAEPKSMSYTASYIAKSMTKKGDVRLYGRTPEFALQSRKPGLGHGFVKRAVKAYNTQPGQAAIKKTGWIETAWRTENQDYPIGRYLKEKIILGLGLTREQRSEHLKIQYAKIAARSLDRTATQDHNRRKARIQKQSYQLSEKGKTL